MAPDADAPSAPAPEKIVRSAGPGEAVTIEVPVIPKEMRTVRIPAHSGPTAIAYVKDLPWVDTPDRLFQDLLDGNHDSDDEPDCPRSGRSPRSIRGVTVSGNNLFLLRL